jgi:hypothetical protein
MFNEKYGEGQKAREMYNKAKSDSGAVNAAIAAIAGYLARTDLTSAERESAEKAKSILQ